MDMNQEFKDLLSGNICDAMELLGLRRSVIHGLTLIGNPDSVMVGPARTLRQVPKHGCAPKADRLVRHTEVSSHLAQPGEVVVMDVGGIREVCSWGEVHSLKCQARKVAGLIIDGCVRDVNCIRKIGFPVFCLGFSPVKSQWDLETVSMNEPVMIGGVQVRQGDIVFGDETGIIVVPAERKEDVFLKAREIRNSEEKTVSEFLKQSKRGS